MSFELLGYYLVFCSIVIFGLAVYFVIIKFKRLTEDINLYGNLAGNSFKNPDKKIFKERRVFERLGIELDAILNIPEQKNVFEAQTKDISSRGVGVKSRIFFPEKTHVEINLILSKTDQFVTKGMVVWSKENYDGISNLGIKFDNLLTNEMIRVYKYFDELKNSNSKLIG